MAKKQAPKKAAVKKPAAKKETPAPKKVFVELDPNKMYDFLVTKKSKHMKIGTYTIDGVMADLLTKKGLGSVKS